MSSLEESRADNVPEHGASREPVAFHSAASVAMPCFLCLVYNTHDVLNEIEPKHYDFVITVITLLILFRTKIP